MLFGILKHFDSLREFEIGMKAEAHKLRHLGMNYLVRRSTLAEANIRRPQEFFARVYAYLLDKYAKFLADSRPSKSYKGQTHEPKDWEKLLYMMDSTTITLFDNILKGVGRHPKSGKKKGGMKVHTVMKYHVGVPMVVQLTSAAKHDHYLLNEVHLQKKETGISHSLMSIDDSFKKTIIVKDHIMTRRNEEGILTIGLFDFLLKENSLDL